MLTAVVNCSFLLPNYEIDHQISKMDIDLKCG